MEPQWLAEVGAVFFSVRHQHFSDRQRQAVNIDFNRQTELEMEMAQDAARAEEDRLEKLRATKSAASTPRVATSEFSSSCSSRAQSNIECADASWCTHATENTSQSWVIVICYAVLSLCMCAWTAFHDAAQFSRCSSLLTISILTGITARHGQNTRTKIHSLSPSCLCGTAPSCRCPPYADARTLWCPWRF